VLPSAVAVAGVASPSAHARDLAATVSRGWSVQIEDGLALGGRDATPDSVSVSPPTDFFGQAQSSPLVSIARGGQVISGGYTPSVSLADLHDGDEIVVREGQDPRRAELFRFTYRAELGLDGPVCAGRQLYIGSRTPGAQSVWGSTASFAAAPTIVSLPWSDYPGGAVGYVPVDARVGRTDLIGNDRITYDARRPTKVGMRVGFQEKVRASDQLSLTVTAEQAVIDCSTLPPAPEPTTPPVAQAPLSTPSPGEVAPSAPPPADVRAPVATLGGQPVKHVGRTSRRKLIGKGLPFVVTTDEAGTVTGAIRLVSKHHPTRTLRTLNTSLIVGRNVFRVHLPGPGRHAVRHSRRSARLVLTLTVVDPAGNVTTLPRVKLRFR
jgi:hypothetical protein